MGVYLVERVFPGATLDQVKEAQRAVIEMSQRFVARGEPIRHLRSIYIPGQCRHLCLIEAPDPQRIEELHEVARASFSNIVEVVDLPLNG